MQPGSSHPAPFEQLDMALQVLHAALTGIELYSPVHPAVLEHRARASELIASAVANHGPIVVSLVGNQVVIDDSVLSSSVRIREGLMARLAARGFNRITFAPGFCEADAADLLLALTAPAASPWRFDCAHITLADMSASRASDRPLSGPASGRCERQSASGNSIPLSVAAHCLDVGQLWNQCLSRREVDCSALNRVVIELSSAITPNTSELIPLAELKRHDEYTFAHTINVAIMSAALAEVCGLSRREVHDITVAAVLHDVGKTRVPQDLLNKNGKLTGDELQVMRAHPIEGARILLEARGVIPLAPIVAFEHHLHPDGSGYPSNIGPRPLHIASRIVQVADVFDALRTDRPYRAALSVEQAREIMMKDAGTSYDPAMLAAFFDRVVSRSRRDASDSKPDAPQSRAA